MRIALVTNILNPYRSSFFEKCHEYALSKGDEFVVYAMTGEKDDRPWRYDEFSTNYTRLLKSKTLKIPGLTYLHFNWGVEKEIKNFRPDVVIMAGSYLQPTVNKLLLLSSKYGYKTVFWSESHFNEQRSYNVLIYKIRELLRKRILCKFDGFWYPGERAKEFVDKYKQKNAVLIRVPNVIDEEFFQKKEHDEIIESLVKKLKESNSQRILLTTARLVKVKGLIEFCEIIKDIDPQKYVWIIAGEGELKDTLQAIINNNGINAKLIGQQSKESIRSLCQLSDVMLLPSISDPNPLSVIESLWCGLALFLSENVGNVPETVIPDINGYEFSYADKEDPEPVCQLCRKDRRPRQP